MHAYKKYTYAYLFFINTMFNKINGKELLIIFQLRLNISLVKDSKAIPKILKLRDWGHIKLLFSTAQSISQ